MYFVGQRWFSEAEPELGIGIISEQEHKRVTIYFPAVDITRTYSKGHPPIKRVQYLAGDNIKAITADGEKSFVVTSVEIQNNIHFYICGEEVIPEMILKGDVFFTNPQDKILAGNFDSNHFFEQRYSSFLHLRAYQQCRSKGLLGPKVALLPHQLSVTQEVSKRPKVRVMLADEVGLGKTIEAALILNTMIMRSRAQKVLVITPDSLINQWFVELYRKFHLPFKLIQDPEDITSESEGNPFNIINFSATQEQEIKSFIEKTDWDVIVVDEAHQISSTNQKYPHIFSLLKYLCAKTPNILLLTATPEILGPQEHFERLQLLDEQRFTNFEQYQQDISKYQDLIPLINDLLDGKSSQKAIQQAMQLPEEEFTNNQTFINFLIDCHGTGRIYFRNTRENLEKHNIHFPRRILHPYPLTISGKIDDKIVLEQKTMIILELLAQNKGEKILVICHSKALVLQLFKMISAQINANIATFHSDQSTLERDRQSAFFADPEGADLMLCTETGSEGRNFEFSHHLILLDMPKIPDQLEQRIGRLDRIGQSKDINIHVPFVENSFEEVLFRFYRDVLLSFEKCPQGSMALYKQVKDSLQQLLAAPYSSDDLANFIANAKEKYVNILEKLAKGHDRLLDLSSFNEGLATDTITEVKTLAREHDLKQYLAAVFDTIGVDVQELNSNTDFAIPSSNMRIPSFPGLTDEGRRYSYDREYALKHDNIELMSWEHPLAQGTIELFVDSELGNVTVTESMAPLPFNIAFECIFRLEAIALKNDDINLFFPMTPLRILIDINGKDFTSAIKMSSLKSKLKDVGQEYKDQLKHLPKDQINQLLAKAKSLAMTKIKKYTDQAEMEIKQYFSGELSRLEELIKRSPLLNQEDISELRTKQKDMIEKLKTATINLDSIRMIINK